MRNEELRKKINEKKLLIHQSFAKQNKKEEKNEVTKVEMEKPLSVSHDEDIKIEKEEEKDTKSKNKK